VDRLAPVHDEQLRSLRRSELAEFLFEQITADRVDRRRTRRHRFRQLVGRRRGRVAAAAAGVAVAAAGVLIGIGTPTQPAAAGIEFVPREGYLVARVVDLRANTEAMQAAFRERGLDIELELVPVSPSLVGEIVASSESEPGIQHLRDARRGCPEELRCGPIGLRIPLGWDGEAEIVLGRAARASESYVSAGDAFAPGEALHCARGVIGATVANAGAVFERRGLAVIWHVDEEIDGVVVGRIVESPKGILDWVVVHAVPAARGSVHVFAEEIAPTDAGFRRFRAGVNAGC
jgi:hypothetical protein